MLRSLNKSILPLSGLIGGYALYTTSGRTNTVNTAASSTQIKDFTKLKVKSTVQETHNVKRVTFELPDLDRPLAAPAISAVMVKKEGEGKPIMKPYNPINQLGNGEFSLCVKKYSCCAKMGGYIHDLEEGDMVEVKYGWRQFQYQANQYKNVACIAGGTGATPLIQLVESAMADEDDLTHFTLIFANKSDGDIFYKQQLDTLSTQHPDKLKVVYAVEKASPEFWSSLPFPSRGIVGRVTKEVVQDHVHAAADADSLVLVCGPGGMYHSVCGPKIFPKGGSPQQGPLLGILKEAGFTEQNVVKL